VMGGGGSSFLGAVGGGWVWVEGWGRPLIRCGDEDAQTAIIFSKRFARWFGPAVRLGDQNSCAIILALASGRRLDANLIRPFPYVPYFESLITISNTIKFIEHNHLFGHSTCLIYKNKEEQREKERCKHILCICTSCIYVYIYMCLYYLCTYVFRSRLHSHSRRISPSIETCFSDSPTHINIMPKTSQCYDKIVLKA